VLNESLVDGRRLFVMQTTDTNCPRQARLAFENFLNKLTLMTLVVIACGCYHKKQEIILATYSLESEHLAREKWPSFIRRTESIAEESGISLESVAVRQIDFDEFFFHAESSKELLQFFRAEWRLYPIEGDSPLIRSFRERISPVGDLFDCDYFVSSSLLEKDKGECIILCESNKRGLIIGHYYFNF
jgi:hypothetical protein